MDNKEYGICPKCGSDNVSNEELTFIDDNEAHQEFYCEDCNCCWNEVFVYKEKVIVEE